MLNKEEIEISKRHTLSKHFTLFECLKSDHKDLIHYPPIEIIEYLTLGCEMLLEPIREKFGIVIINSAYRSAELNNIVGGNKHSDHLIGTAFDIYVMQSDIYRVYAWAAKNSYYRQLIIYPRKGFIHISYNVPEKLFKKEAFSL